MAEAGRPAASLATRLFSAAALWSTVALVIAGFTLSNYYRNSVERAFDEQLNFYLRSLVFDISSHGELSQADLSSIGDPRFDFPLSGWYWQVSRYRGGLEEMKASASLFDWTLPRLAEQDPEGDLSVEWESYVDGPDDQRLRLIERVVTLPSAERVVVAVAGDATDIEREMAGFNRALVLNFLVLGLGLVAVASFQVRWGLRPLTAISQEIARIREGDQTAISGAVPHEIAPLARELNALLDSNREIVERARTHVGNLAHALKTPLSVIVNEADASDSRFAGKVREQAGIMRTQIDHHLDRARIAAGAAVVGAMAEIGPVLDGLANAMRRINAGRRLEIVTRVEPARFRGERQDLQEMVGNLLDNACKWATSRVSVEVALARRSGPSGRDLVSIVVDDDGPGLTQAQRAEVLARGKRLDETKPGSGLGLAIVADLVSLYGGTFVLGVSPMGGLRAEMRLPAA